MASLLQQAQRDALRFAEADVDGNNELNFDEFLAMQPKKILEQYGEDDIREWFQAADTDNSGTVSMNEWFMWTLARQTLNGADALRNLFRAYDKDRQGTLDLDEFQALANDMGFGAAAHEIFLELDQDGGGNISYEEILAMLLPSSALTSAAEANDCDDELPPPASTFGLSSPSAASCACSEYSCQRAFLLSGASGTVSRGCQRENKTIRRPSMYSRIEDRAHTVVGSSPPVRGTAAYRLSCPLSCRVLSCRVACRLWHCRVVSRVGGARPRAGKRYRCSVYSTKKPSHAIPISRRISIYPSVFRKLHTRTRTACEQDRG